MDCFEETNSPMEVIAPAVTIPSMVPETEEEEWEDLVPLEPGADHCGGAMATDVQETPAPMTTIPSQNEVSKNDLVADEPAAAATAATAMGVSAATPIVEPEEESPLNGVPREVSFSFSTDPGAGDEPSTSRRGSLLVWTPETDPSPMSPTSDDNDDNNNSASMINGTVAPYSDFLAKQSAEIKATKKKARQAQEALTSPARSSPVLIEPSTSSISDNDQPIGAIGAYSDFVTKQSAQLLAAKEKEREARASLSNPARASVSSSPVAATTLAASVPGLVAPYGDFVAQQTALNKKMKEAERQAREQLSAPARSNSIVAIGPSLSPNVSDDGLMVVPPTHVDFMTQQSARLKAEKEQERQTRKMLNEGATTNATDAGCPLNSFEAEQMARIKATKEKERQAREMLNTPARSNPVGAASIEAGLVSPFADFQTMQTAQIKAAREKERQTRQMMNEPAVAHGASPLSDFTAQQSASIKAAKEKERETRANLSCISTTAESTTDRLAVELLRRKEEAQQQKRAAQELKHGYRNGAPEGATDRMAAEMKRQREMELLRKKEAEELSRTFRNNGDARNAGEQMADEMKRQREEALLKKKQAEEYSRSFRHNSGTSGSAAEVMADEMKRRREQELRKKQEAEEYSRSYKTAAGESAQDVVAATLKRQKEFDLLRKREAMTMTSSYRSASVGTDSAQERLAMEVKKRRDEEIQRKKQEEQSLLKYVKELSERDQELTETTEDETSSTNDMATVESMPSALEHLKAKTETELETLRGAGTTSLRDIASEFDKGIQSDGVERLKKEREQELRAVQASTKQNLQLRELEQQEEADAGAEQLSTKPGKLSDAVIRQMASSIEDITKVKTSSVEDELLALRQEGNIRSAAAEFCRTASANDKYDQIKAKTSSELAGIQGVATSAKDMVQRFASSFTSPGYEQVMPNEKYDQIKARTSSELANLQGGSTSAKDLVGRFTSSFTSPGLEQIKSRTANELSVLSGKGSSLRDLTAEFSRVSSSKAAVDRLKKQTANELAAIRAEQRLSNTADAEESETVDAPDFDCDSMAFSAEELASFEEEKKQREMELQDLRRLSSRKSLASIRSRTADELEQIAAQRKNSITSQGNDA